METRQKDSLVPLVCGDVGAGDRARQLQDVRVCAQVSLYILMGQRVWLRVAGNLSSVVRSHLLGNGRHLAPVEAGH